MCSRPQSSSPVLKKTHRKITPGVATSNLWLDAARMTQGVELEHHDYWTCLLLRTNKIDYMAVCNLFNGLDTALEAWSVTSSLIMWDDDHPEYYKIRVNLCSHK